MSAFQRGRGTLLLLPLAGAAVDGHPPAASTGGRGLPGGDGRKTMGRCSFILLTNSQKRIPSFTKQSYERLNSASVVHAFHPGQKGPKFANSINLH